tara:strand:- start:1318 stop:1710 length:393 start_codon:yes stop_codon:yes gene_type:complete
MEPTAEGLRETYLLVREAMPLSPTLPTAEGLREAYLLVKGLIHSLADARLESEAEAISRRPGGAVLSDNFIAAAFEEEEKFVTDLLDEEGLTLTEFLAKVTVRKAAPRLPVAEEELLWLREWEAEQYGPQ